jgi:hypothetical protein
MRSAGFSDDSCVSIVEIYHQHGKPFTAGESVAGLVQASMDENAILELARMDQLGVNVGEFQAMRLAGLSDEIILETAKHEAAGTPSPSGPSRTCASRHSRFCDGSNSRDAPTPGY